MMYINNRSTKYTGREIIKEPFNHKLENLGKEQRILVIIPELSKP